MEKEIEGLSEELLDYARRRYQSEKNSLMSLLDLKEKEVLELRSAAGVFEEKLRAAQTGLDEERTLRMEELSRHQEEFKALEAGVQREQQAHNRALNLQEAAIAKLKGEIAEYQDEIKKIMEENRQNVVGLNDEVRRKDIEIETLRSREKELESKIVAVESAAKQGAQMLAAKILELENFLREEKEARFKVEESSKNAVAASTAALIEERSKVEIFQNRAAELSRDVARIEEEKKKILDHWQTERKKWEELWERERKVWENQKMAMMEWESRHIKEKAQWENFLREKEEKEIRLARVFSNFFAEFGRWTGKPGSAAGTAPGLAPSVSPEPEALGAPAKKEKKGISLKAAVATAAALLMSAGGFWGYRYWKSSGPLIYHQSGSWDLPFATPSGLALEKKEGESWLWVCDWKSGEIIKLSGEDPQRIVKRFESPSTFFHPNSIAIDREGKFLFTLDSVSHKVARRLLAAPAQPLEEVETPTPSSLLLAMVDFSKDQALAVLDTVGRGVYFFHPLKFKDKPTLVFSVPEEIAPAAFAGDGQSLWILDANTALIHQFAPDSKNQWQRRKTLKIILPEGSQTAASAPAFLIPQPNSLYLILEGDPARLILTNLAASKN